MATTNKVLIQIDNEVVELKGAEKEAFLEERTKAQAEYEVRKTEKLTLKQIRIDAYTKLGLTEEEINAIL